MLVQGLDVAAAVKLILKHIDFVTCFQCCKYYIAPETAACGHTLCHLCWKGQRTCPSCGETIIKKSLALNMVMKIISEHVRDLVEPFEIMSGMKMEEFGLEVQELNRESENPVAKNVKEWLSSSQNHFSVPPNSETQKSIPDNISPIELSSSKIQIHAEPNKVSSPPRVAHVAPPQDDWDVIKPATDTEDMVCVKDKQNIVGPMDLEPFYMDYDKEYTTNNPRRSSRKRDSINSSSKKTSAEKNDSIVSENDKKLDKAKQNWTNVKKMKKEFGKLTKNNKSKLNVSIEMCKRTNSDKKGNLVTIDKLKDTTNLPSVQTYVIEDDTPEIEVKNNNKEAKLEQKESTVTTMKVRDKDISVKNTDQYNNKDSIIKSGQSRASKTKSKDNDVITNSKDNDSKDIANQSKDSSDNKEKNHSQNVPFVKKSNFQADKDESHTVIVNNIVENDNLNTSNTYDEDIHITIRIGTVVTNITINKKRDVKLKVNSDREVQASLGRHILTENNETTCKNSETTDHGANVENETENIISKKLFIESNKIKESDKSLSTKKNTASAETVTAQYEISESVEKELSNVMECEDIAEKIPQPVSNTKPAVFNKPATITQKPHTTVLAQTTEDNDVIETELGFLDEVDIFNSGSVKELNVKSLKHVKGTPSEILVPTNKTRVKTQREKRHRDLTEEEESQAKKQKHATQDVIDNSEVIPETNPDKLIDMNSEAITYDAVMSQVFANIDADIRDTQTSKNVISLSKEYTAKKNQLTQIMNKEEITKDTKQTKTNTDYNQKYSENMFSTIGHLEQEHQVAGPETQRNIDNLLTPGMCKDLGDTNETRLDIVIGTPNQNDDSDHSIVEETPQKDKSKALSKADSSNKTVISNKKLQLKSKPNTDPKDPSKDADDIINITDSVTFEKLEESNETVKPRNILETPLTINRFLDDIKHKSTPVARKSLDFARNKANEEDDNITVCPSANIIANTTQEKAIMSEAFANVNSPLRRPLSAMNTIVPPPVSPLCIAGSCLSNSNIINVKILCFKRKWKFVDKYVPELTHLVVGVDEENRAQRSVKYMCALAGSKWIVSFRWVEMCLEMNKIVNEEYFEALDSTRDPGPRNSRLARQKIFKGIKFYCMPPFSVLDLDTLKAMLEAAGGTVVHDLSAVRAKPDCPSLVLAEPANTEEDRFMYLTMEAGVVPINYEWVLNCLGSYTLCSIYDLLLCPTSLLPDATKMWPLQLISTDDSNIGSILE